MIGDLWIESLEEYEEDMNTGGFGALKRHSHKRKKTENYLQQQQQNTMYKKIFID